MKAVLQMSEGGNELPYNNFFWTAVLTDMKHYNYILNRYTILNNKDRSKLLSLEMHKRARASYFGGSV